MVSPKSPKIKKEIPICQHIGLFVQDLEKENRFYIRQLGFKFEREILAGEKMMKDIFGIDSSCRIQFLSLHNFGVELFFFLNTRLRRRYAKTSGFNHWALLVNDKVSFCQRLKRKKIKVIKIKKPHGHTYFIEDPEKNLIEVKNYFI